MQQKESIISGQAILGIEFGSTRIKAVLTAPDCSILATGIYDWENSFADGYWTYGQDEILAGLQGCYADLCNHVTQQYGVPLTQLAALGISAMMHGYLALGADDAFLVPFRTWRNTTTATAAEALTARFDYNIPQRWSIAHLYQAMLDKEPHLSALCHLTTLAGYLHFLLSGEKVLGVGDASGMFPISPDTKQFDAALLDSFAPLAADYPWALPEVLPRVLVAGQSAGALSAAGAALLDPSGKLAAGVPLCPPEGDAGTGMVATNSVKVRTGNISAGTSIFAMIVMEHALHQMHPEIDLVTTPSGDLVAMVHCNNCTSDINGWVNLFDETLRSAGVVRSRQELFTMLYQKALEGDADCGGLLSYNYYSGEPITQLAEGRPVFVQGLNSKFTLANFMRCHLYSCVATLKLGMDILLQEEKIALDKIVGHGGFFKTKGVGQTIMADALSTPVTVMETAGEGGAWGIAVLAAYLVGKVEGEPLDAYLTRMAFQSVAETTTEPSAANEAGFADFMQRYTQGIAVEQTAVECL